MNHKAKRLDITSFRSKADRLHHTAANTVRGEETDMMD